MVLETNFVSDTAFIYFLGESLDHLASCVPLLVFLYIFFGKTIYNKT